MGLNRDLRDLALTVQLPQGSQALAHLLSFKGVI